MESAETLKSDWSRTFGAISQRAVKIFVILIEHFPMFVNIAHLLVPVSTFYDYWFIPIGCGHTDTALLIV